MSLDVLYSAVSWVLLRWHQALTAIGLDPAGGLNWALSIVLLVVTARLLLFRLFLNQVRHQRRMQQLQPQLRALRERFGHDRPELQRRTAALQREHRVNPVAGCLPMLLQIPVFVALLHVLRHLASSAGTCAQGLAYRGDQLSIYTFTRTQTCDAARARLLDAPLAGTLRDSASTIENALGGSLDATRIVTVALVVVSAAVALATQLLVARSAAEPPTGTAATVQRSMQVVVPVSVLVSGVFFPLGVLLYWCTGNVWTLLQQLYVQRFLPHPTPDPTPDARPRDRSARAKSRSRV